MYRPGDRREPEDSGGGQGGWNLAGKTRHKGTTGEVPGPSQPGKELGFCCEVSGKASVGFRFYV